MVSRTEQAVALGCSVDDLRGCVQACHDGSAQACNTTAFIYEKGLSEMTNYRLASEYYRWSCEAAFPQGCNNLGWLFMLGKGVPQSKRGALAMFELAYNGYRLSCLTGDAGSCVLAANQLLLGQVKETPDDRAVAYLNRACQLGHTESCGQDDFLADPYQP